MSKEIWKSVTAKGSERYWRYSTGARRALPMKKSDAEYGLAIGSYTLIAKPEYVGK